MEQSNNISNSEIVRILRQTEMFRHVDPARLKVVAMMAKTSSYDTGEWVFHTGAQSEAAFVLLTGEVNVVVERDDNATIVAKLGAGELFGEMAAITGAPRTAGIQANSAIQALRLDRDTLMQMLREFPELSLALLGILARRLEATTSELASR